MTLISTTHRMVDFREAGPAELQLIINLAYETWQKTFETMIPAAQLNYMLNAICSEASLKKQMLELGHPFILIEKEGVALGFVSYELNYNAEPQLMIHNLYLLSEFQGQGIGTKVLHLLSEIALRNNHKQLRLKVFFKNVKAIGFYKKSGFKHIGIEMTYKGNHYNVFDNIMQKEL